MQQLRSLLRIKHNYTDPFELLKARGLAATVWLLIGLALIYLALSSLITPSFSSQPFLIIGTAVLLFYVGVILQINRGNLVAASVTFVIIVYAVVTFVYLRSTTYSPTTFLPLIIPVVAAGVLLNRRGMVVMLILVVLALALGAVTRTFAPTAPTATTSPINVIVVSAFIMSVCLAMLYVFAGGQISLQRRTLSLTRELRSSTQITQTITGIKNTNELLEQSVLMIRDQLGYYHVRIFLQEERTGLLILRASTIPLIEQRRVAPDDTTVLNQVLRTGKSAVITRAGAESHRKELLPNMNTGIVTALKREQTLFGVLDVQTISTDEVAPSEIEVLEAVAAQIAIAIENTRLFSELESASKDRAELAEKLRATTTEFEQFVQESLGRAWTRYLEGKSDGLVGFDWREGSITENNYVSSSLEKAFENSMPELTHDGDEQILTVPIISRGQRLGAMEFRAPSTRTWSNRSIELAHVVAQRLALALDNLRLFEQAQNIATREYTASQIAATLQSQTDIDALISTAAETFQQALGATRASVRLGTPERRLAQTGLLGQSGQNGRHNQ
jgi:GAF domain-containing protein